MEKEYTVNDIISHLNNWVSADGTLVVISGKDIKTVDFMVANSGDFYIKVTLITGETIACLDQQPLVSKEIDRKWFTQPAKIVDYLFKKFVNYVS